MEDFQRLLNKIKSEGKEGSLGSFDIGSMLMPKPGFQVTTGGVKTNQAFPIITGGSTPALDADGRPIPGTSTGFGMESPSVGNLQQVIKQKIPAITLDGGKTYIDPRDGTLIDTNKLGPKDFFLTPGY